MRLFQENINVFDASIQRLKELYNLGHRIIVSFSGGKDSGVCLELAIIAARETGNLPVEVIMRDEEIMMPGTFEYAERMYKRKELNFHWVSARQPIINVFNRESPYWWVFDKQLSEDQWVRKPPSWIEWIPEQDITWMINTEKYPPAKGKDLISIVGLRTLESPRRQMAIQSIQGYLTKQNIAGVRRAHVIYDWSARDVWKAIRDNKWDYNHAYDTFYRLTHSTSGEDLRIAPPTMSIASIPFLKLASKAWPHWFDKVSERVPGIRAAARFGKRSVLPSHRLGESWEDTFKRECIDEAPSWIAERSGIVMLKALEFHSHHSCAPYLEATKCRTCPSPGCWRQLAMQMYMGNPWNFSGQYEKWIDVVQPEQFRKGAGYWRGKPTW